MRNIARILATVSVLVVVSACGTDSGGDDGTASSNSQSSTSPDESSDDSGSAVVSVSLHRTGGLKPVTVNRVFSADTAPPPGYDEGDVTAALAAASNFTRAGIQVTPVPSNTCCDRYTYDVTITYADGSSKRFTTIDGLQQPKVFAMLLQAVS